MWCIEVVVGKLISFVVKYIVLVGLYFVESNPKIVRFDKVKKSIPD